MIVTDADHEDFEAAVKYYGLDTSFQYHERPEILLEYVRQYRIDMARNNSLESFCHLAGVEVVEDCDQPGMFIYRARVSFPSKAEAIENAYLEASRSVMKWHDLSFRLWASLSETQRYELAQEMAAAADERENDGNNDDALSESEKEAIEAFRASKGRMWKTALGACWERSHYPGMTVDHAAALQRLRNTHGPEWLSKFRVAPVDTEVVATASPAAEDEPARPRPPRPRC